MKRQLPESISGPVAVLGSVATLTRYAVGAIAAETWSWARSEIPFRVSRARMRRHVAHMQDEVMSS